MGFLYFIYHNKEAPVNKTIKGDILVTVLAAILVVYLRLL